jgi:predicted nuclease with TOPRIM domain
MNISEVAKELLKQILVVDIGLGGAILSYDRCIELIIQALKTLESEKDAKILNLSDGLAHYVEENKALREKVENMGKKYKGGWANTLMSAQENESKLQNDVYRLEEEISALRKRIEEAETDNLCLTNMLREDPKFDWSRVNACLHKYQSKVKTQAIQLMKDEGDIENLRHSLEVARETIQFIVDDCELQATWDKVGRIYYKAKHALASLSTLSKKEMK